MPKVVDHEQRRAEIARAVWRIATVQGLSGVTFREVAADAGVSVSLVQHYFGTKQGLVIWSLDHNTARMADRIVRRLGRAGEDPPPRDVLRIVAGSFIPTDAESREGMLVYHAFAAAALTDPALRRAEAFRNETVLVDHLGLQLRTAAEAGILADGVDTTADARALLALVLGLSLGVLLGRMKPGVALSTIDRHLDRLFVP